MGMDDSALKIQTIIYDDYTSFEGKISTLDESDFVYIGCIEKEWFNYNTNSLVGEIYHLLDNHSIKSFQAILDDGRIVNFSCLN